LRAHARESWWLVLTAGIVVALSGLQAMLRDPSAVKDRPGTCGGRWRLVGDREVA
jgi:hypothetical protein